MTVPAGSQAVDRAAALLALVVESGEPRTFTSLVDELGLAKSTAHHHLAILRHAGFVTIRDENENVYSLRRDLLPQAGELLTAYLGSARSSSTSA